MEEIIAKFMNEFDELLKKHKIDDVVLINFDDNEMGHRQLVKIIDSEDGRLLVFSFSGSGKSLCPCCGEFEEKEHKDDET